MSNLPTYAIVCVTYNRIDLLKECITNMTNQTVAPNRIIIVNNASTDGTYEYLNNIATDGTYEYLNSIAADGVESSYSSSNLSGKLFHIVNSDTNLGGSGGFCLALSTLMDDIDEGFACDYVLIIDDDAMIREDYCEKLLSFIKDNPAYKAAAGTVMAHSAIDTDHRKFIKRPGFLIRNCDVSLYNNNITDHFDCDNASFCGLMVSTNLCRAVGLPHSDYFIWHDDTEYSVRLRKHTSIAVIPSAILNHKTMLVATEKPRHYTWKDYYGIRNRISLVKEHGNFIDLLVLYIDMFINVRFRNFVFALTKRAGSDWSYERKLVRRAFRDAKNNVKGKVDLDI